MLVRKSIAALVAMLLTVTAMLGLSANPGAAAAPGGSDGLVNAQFAAQWLLTQFEPEGYVGGPEDSAATYASTAQATLSLIASFQGEDTVQAAVAWLEAGAAARVPVDGSADPGLIGYLLMVSYSVGIDPTDFGGVDLIAALDATLTDSGLYGTASPIFDGVYRQSLAILGLHASGILTPEEAIDWLVDQQCVGAPTEAAGGWLAFRADTSVPCPAPDPSSFSGPDTNSTALATQALTTVGTTPGADPLTYLHSMQDPVSGGFGYIGGSDVDPNSTALVIQAIAIEGEDPTEGRWVRDEGDPLQSLGSWQLDCSAAPDEVGAYQASWKPGPDLMATIQGIWGANQAFFPLWPEMYTPRSTFVDVCVNHPFFEEIVDIAYCGITQGYEDGTFRPAAVTSRQAFVAFMYRMSEMPPFVAPEVPTFRDVPITHPFYTEIEWAAAEGITTGYGDDTFRPSADVSRQSAAVFVYRTEGSPPFVAPETPSFTDVPATHAFYDEIEWAASEGIVTGYGNGTFEPTAVTTRQAAAAFVVRTMAAEPAWPTRP